MKRLFLVFLGGVAGFVAGYFAGVEVACDWLIPTSNLCGIYGVFLAGPIAFDPLGRVTHRLIRSSISGLTGFTSTSVATK